MRPADEHEERPLIADVDLVVHAPARLAIMMALHVAKRADFVFLQRRTGLTPGNLSSHLARLEAAGYIAVDKTFVDRVPRTLVRLTRAGTDAFKKYRQQMKLALGDQA
jgi:DNA-binding MarR family transcriptional regulator